MGPQDASTAAPELGERIAFLVGARRSGTNWIHRILGAHRAVAVVPSETHLFSHGIAPLVERFHHGPGGSPRTAYLHMEHDDLFDACRQFCDRALTPYLERAPGAALLVERTPLHVFHLGLIRSVYPRARVLHIIRDGRDVARSLVSQEWGDHGPDDLVAGATEWRDAVTAARAADGGHDRYREVRYEDLFADPAAVTADVYRWLGLSADEDDVERARVEAAGRFNVDRAAPAITTQKWRSLLSVEEVAAIERVAGPTLRELGYAEADPHGDDPTPAASTPRTTARPGPPPAATRTTTTRTDRHRPPLAARLRRRASQLRTRVRELRSPPAPPRPKGASPVDMERQARAVDHFLDALHTGDPDRLPPLTRDVRVRIVSGTTDWSGRGDEAVARLFAVTAEEGVTAGRQTRSDVHAGAATFAVVTTYETADVPAWDVVWILHPRGDRITGVSYYRFPLPRAER